MCEELRASSPAQPWRRRSPPSCALADDSHASVRLTASLPRCGCSWSRPCTPWRTRATARGLAPGQVS